MNQKSLVKQVGKQWNDLSAEQKAPFEALGLSDKARYQKELKEVESNGYFTNSNGEKCKPAPKKASKQAMLPEKDQPIFKYKL